MITREVKNKIDKIWSDLWAGGISNPITVIEQLTYLMFIRSLDEKETEREGIENLMNVPQEKIFPQTPEGQSMRWGKFEGKDTKTLSEVLFAKKIELIYLLKI